MGNRIGVVRNSSSTSSSLKGLKRALFVGINYTNSQYALAGCINDANDMASLVTTLHPFCDTAVLTDNGLKLPTKANILLHLQWLVTGLRPGQNVLFHYSGHGGLIRDNNGDEISGKDSVIYPWNGRILEIIRDDEIRSKLVNKIPTGCKCFVILDTCHSGSAVDLRYMWRAPSATTLSFVQDTRHLKTNGSVVFLSGCRDDQTSADTALNGRPCGALTMSLLYVWRQHGSSIKTKRLLWEVRAFLKQRGYSQIPQLSSGRSIDISDTFDLSL